MKLPQVGGQEIPGLPSTASHLFLGVDPGSQGALAIVDGMGLPVERIRLSKSTDADIHHWLETWADRITFATLEYANSRSGQGVSSTFKFGRAYGFLEGMLIAHRIPYELVTPVKWQNVMKCRTGGDKNITKAAAQRLFPRPPTKIVHEDADSWIIAEFCRRKQQGRI